MLKQGLSDWIRVPCLIARGALAESYHRDLKADGVGAQAAVMDTILSRNAKKANSEIVVGMTAALHGNEVLF